MKPVLAALVLLVGYTAAAQQQVPRFELSSSYAYGSTDSGSSGRLYGQGWLGSVTTNLNRWVGVEGQVGGQYNNQTYTFGSTSYVLNGGFYSFLAGPRVAYRAHNVTPFAHGLVGVNRILDYGNVASVGASGALSVPYTTSFGAAVGGGVDYVISRHFALRTSVDYFLTPLSKALVTTNNNFRVMAGVVFTFGDTSARSVLDAKQQPALAPDSAVAPAPATAEAVKPAEPVEAPKNAIVAQQPAPVMAMAAVQAPAPAPARAAVSSAPKHAAATSNAAMPVEIISTVPTTAAYSSAYNSAPSQPQESLGEIARRYRRAKEHQQQ